MMKSPQPTVSQYSQRFVFNYYTLIIDFSEMAAKHLFCRHNLPTLTITNGTSYIKKVAFMTSQNELSTVAKATTTGTALKLVQDTITDSFYIEGLEETAQLIVSDLHCSILIKQRITNRELVSISLLRKGIYIAKLITTRGIVEKKLVKA